MPAYCWLKHFLFPTFLLFCSIAGTHWCFEIISMLLNGTIELSPIQKMSLMLINVPEEDLDKMKSPRVLNTHFPFRMLPKQTQEKQTKIILVLRNPKDVSVSLYYHHTGMNNYFYNGTFSDHLKLFMEGKRKKSGRPIKFWHFASSLSYIV